MKKSYRLILGLCVIAVCLYFVADVSAKSRMSIEELQEELNLTDEQAEAIVPIIQKDRKEKEAIVDKYREQGMAGISSMREELKSLQKEHDSKYSEILTDEQMKNYIDLRKKESRERRAESRSRKPEK